MNQICCDRSGTDQHERLDQHRSTGKSHKGEKRKSGNPKPQPVYPSPQRWPTFRKRSHEICEAEASCERKTRKHCREAVRPTNIGEPACIEDFRALQPHQENKRKHDGRPVGHRMRGHHRDTCHDQHGCRNEAGHTGKKNCELPIMRKKRGLRPGKDRRRISGIGDTDCQGSGCGRRDRHLIGVPGKCAHPVDGHGGVRTRHLADFGARTAREKIQRRIRRIFSDKNTRDRPHRLICRRYHVPARCIRFPTGRCIVW